MKLLLSQAPCIALPGGELLPLGPRDAALLAWLCLEGPTPRTRLASMFWPHSDAEAARNSLRQRLHHLRKGVGVDIFTGDMQLALAEGIGHDLLGADSVLGQAVHDYSPEFGAWLAHQRERCHDRKLRVLTERAELAERTGEHAQALVHAQEVLRLEPQSEAAHRRTVRLHYLLGDRAAALRAFDRCEQVLKDDIGTRPSAETLALLATIERSAPDAALRPAATMPAALQRPPRLIGRSAERQALAAAIERRGVLLLTGQAGMGKSRLIAALVEAAEGADQQGADSQGDGAPCLSVCARPGDAAAPYALSARWLRALTLRHGMVVTPAQRLALACVLPELGAPAARVRRDDRAQVLAAMQSLLEAAAGAGLQAMVLDDLQYADGASVELLQSLAGHTPCAWILALRPDELSPAARALLEAHATSTTTQTLALQPLGVEAIAAFLDSLGIDGVGGLRQAQVLRQRTGGNPMFLLETLKAGLAVRREAGATDGEGAAAINVSGAVADTGSTPPALSWPQVDSVQRLIQQRLGRLKPLALKLARCAALAGQDFTSALAAEVLRLHPLDLADAWLELEVAQVLHDGAFAHDLIAEAALGLVPRPIAVALHGEIGRILERGAGEPARIAAHWLAAGEPRKAAPHLRRAARRAQAASQRADAALLHAQAAEILRDAGDRRGAFDAFFAAAEAASQSAGRAGFAAYGEALQALADDDGQRAAAALVPLAILLEQCEYDALRRLALQALPRAQAAGLPDIEVELLWDLTLVHLDRRELAEAAQRAEQALARLADVDPATARLTQVGTRFKLTQALGGVLAATGRYAQCNALLMQALQQARHDREWAYTGPLANALAINALEQGSLTQALQWSTQAISDDDRFDGGVHERLSVANGRATVLALHGDLGGALATIETALGLCQPLKMRIETRTRMRLHALQFDLGRRDLAVKGLRELRALAQLQPDECTLIEAELLRAGDSVDAEVLLERAMAIPDLPTQARALCLLQQGCDAARVLPLLGSAAAAARSHGAHGLWLTLQTRRVAALRAVQRFDEARAQALAVWQRVEEGISGVDMFPRMAAELCAALAESHVDLAQVIKLRASAWMHQAAATLPVAWRDNYLSRAPVLQLLLPPARHHVPLLPGPQGHPKTSL